VEKKRKRLLDMLKKVCPDSTSVDDALARIQRMWNDIQEQIDNSQTVIKKHETLRERLEGLKGERAQLLAEIGIPVPEHLTDAFVSDILKTQRAYDEIVADLQTSTRLLNEKLMQYKDVKQQLKAKEEEMTEIINELADIPDDVEQRLEEITVYMHLRSDEKILLGDVSQGEYYTGFEKDARAYVLYKRTSRQITDMLGRHLLKVVDKLPSPSDIEKFNGYIAGIKSRSASLVYHKHFTEIYENIDKIVDMLTELEEKEKKLQIVSTDISTAYGHLKELTRRMQDMKEQEERLVTLMQQVPDDMTRAIEESGMSPEVVLDRLREAHIGMKSLHDSFEKHIVDMNHIQKQIQLLKHIRRHVVPRFFKWYVDMVMSVFRNRLSDNLEMLSGRYRLESMQGDSGIEVYDKWNGAVRPATMLSGGEKTMLGLSFVFALADVVAGYGGHRVFFIDEGFSSLDSQRKQELKPVLENLVSSSGHTIFIITHDESILDSAPPESPVIRMEKGKMKDGISTVGAQLGTSYVGGEESDEDDIGVFLE
jgi:chromosome segregation ATPase